MPSSVCLSGSCSADGADTSGGVGEVRGVRALSGVGAPRLRTIRGQWCVARLPVRSAGGISVARAKISLLPVLIFEKSLPPRRLRLVSLRRRGRRGPARLPCDEEGGGGGCCQETAGPSSAEMSGLASGERPTTSEFDVWPPVVSEVALGMRLASLGVCRGIRPGPIALDTPARPSSAHPIRYLPHRADDDPLR